MRSKVLATMLIGLALSGVEATQVQAQALLGSTSAQFAGLLPSDAKPTLESPDHLLVEYDQLEMGGVVWEKVIARFGQDHRLASVSFRTHAMSFDALEARASAQYQQYVQSQAKLFMTTGAAVDLMQVRLCDENDAGVVMTLETPSLAS